MVTVTLMKTAVAKNLSQSIIICVEHQNFTKPYFWGDARAFPGFHYATPLLLWLFGQFGGLLVDSEESRIRIPVWPPRRDPGQAIRSQLPVALRRETPTSIRAVSGAPLTSRGIEEAL